MSRVPAEPTSLGYCLRITFILSIIYFFSGFLSPYRDAEIHAVVANNILDGQGLSFTGDRAPDSFSWALRSGDREVPVDVQAIDPSISALIASGELVQGKPDYLIQPTIATNRWANTFLPGPTFWGLPFFAIGRMVTPPEQLSFMNALIGKGTAAIAAAISAVFLYLSLRSLYGHGTARGVLFCYAFGTCIWSVASQHLMSHAPNLLFLNAGIYAYLKSQEQVRASVFVGLLWGCAVWCRATSALVIMPVALGWLFYSPVRLLGLLAGGLPLALMLGLHNQLLFGSPWFFGELAQHDSIEQIRGGGGVFQTPLSEGLAGILISPGRGLFVYSPVLIFGLIGLVRGSVGPRKFLCLPMLVGMIAVWIVQALHFDWWGGWTFGYRAVVDTVPVLCIGLAEIYEQISIITWRRWAYRTLLAWSVAVQLVGVLLYDLIGWNGRELWRVPNPNGQTALYEPWSDSPPNTIPPIEIIRHNIDEPEYRDRLWSITDSPLVYYLTHPAVSVRNKVRLSAYTAWEIHFKTAETLTSIAKGFQQLGRPGRALSFIRRAVEIDPSPERKALLDLLEGRKA